jgi:ABC-type multidrug transport system fused ATPase/permease subunit
MVYFYIVMNASSKFGTLSGFRGTLAAATGPLSEVRRIFTEEGKFFVRGGSKHFTGIGSEIACKDLSFSYDDDRTVLSHISFILPKGAMTAIVGPTGAGKSTLINLFMRYYDCPPQSIFVDGTDIREFTLESYLEHVALVSQETLLLHDSLRNNILYGIRREVGDAELNSVLKQARLTDFIGKLSQGVDTLIGDRGVRLSGGEKQRVSIARALLKGADILILDEATSSLDSETEKLIQEAIDEAVQGRTSIVIAHRLSTIRNADKIVVVQDGTIAEEGDLETLLQNKGAFSRLWEQQKF